MYVFLLQELVTHFHKFWKQFLGPIVKFKVIVIHTKCIINLPKCFILFSGKFLCQIINISSRTNSVYTDEIVFFQVFE